MHMDIKKEHYTIEQVASMQGHVELIDGTIVIEDRVSVTHNLIMNDIATSFKNYISGKSGTCKVFTENVALYVSELCDENMNYFLPDLMVVCDANKIDEDGVHTAPLFVAEITSESTKKTDYGEKLNIYRKIGVEEYWVVDIQRKMVFRYLAAEDYVPVAYIYPELMKVSVYEDLFIDLSSYMKQ